MRHSKTTCCLIVLMMVYAALASADVPRYINYQGRLTNPEGEPVPDGPYAISFTIYNHATEGSLLWNSDRLSVDVNNGLFSVQLGPLPSSIFTASSERWLGIQVVGDPEISPRTRFIMVPYACQALVADTARYTIALAPNTVETGDIIDGAIVNDDISPTADIDPSKIDGTAATLSGANTFASSGNQFVDGLSVSSADLVVADNDIAFRRGGDFRWRIKEGASTGLQFYQVYDDGLTLWNKSRFEIGNNGRLSINCSPNSSHWLRLVDTTSSAVCGISSDLRGTGDNDVYALQAVASRPLGKTGGRVYGGTFQATADAGYRYGIDAYCQAADFSITTGITYGVHADAYDGENAYGGYFSGTSATNNFGLFATCEISNGNYGGYFYGNTHATGTETKGGGGYLIDHPLDPENKYLAHSDVSSPEMKNVYDGVVILGANGQAVVELPDYFESLNQDFRYQLTAIGAPAPNLYISEEIKGNRFEIAGGSPSLKISWQVTGIRKDAFATSNRLSSEKDKAADMRGRYMHPEAFGQTIEKAVDYQHHIEALHHLAERGER